MNYQETLDYLYSRLPMFQRIGSAAYKADLDNTIKLDELLDHPHRNFKTIHVGGTNGKGSTSSMLAAILQTAGYNVGLYTSPHLLDFRERVRVNGEMIPETSVMKFVEKYKDDFEKIQPSFFEWTVALAFDYFRSCEVDVAVIEVGLGGRLDSTNIISPLLSVITNISFDHQALLGNSLAEIASEKAGIIKRDIPVIIGEHGIDTDQVFIDAALSVNAPLIFCEDHYKAIWTDAYHQSCKVLYDGEVLYDELKTPLGGDYQLKNIPVVINAIDVIGDKFIVTPEAVREGIMNVKSLTGLRGRWEILDKHPMIIADTGHNEAGIAYILNQLNGYSYRTLRFILGMVNDKDIDKILSLLPKDAVYYFCKASIPRALNEVTLMEKGKEHNLEGRCFASVGEALAEAEHDASSNDLIFIGGSTFTVADALGCF